VPSRQRGFNEGAEQSEHAARAVIASANEAVLVCDRKGIITHANAAARKHSGRDGSGRPPWTIEPPARSFGAADGGIGPCRRRTRLDSRGLDHARSFMKLRLRAKAAFSSAT
jgi:PAS domain-containing protein